MAVTELPSTRVPIDNPRVVARFKQFAREIYGYREEMYVDPDNLRISRRPMDHFDGSQRSSIGNSLGDVLDRKPDPGHSETVEYFTLIQPQKPGRFRFDHAAEVSFLVKNGESNFPIIILTSPSGNQLAIETSEPRSSYGRRTVKVEGNLVTSGMAFRIDYDLTSGKLTQAVLGLKYHLNDHDPEFRTKVKYDQDLLPDFKPVDEIEAKNIIFIDPDTGVGTVLRMPEVINFNDIFMALLPKPAFNSPFTTPEEVNGWHNKNWAAEILKIALTRNFKPVELP